MQTEQDAERFDEGSNIIVPYDDALGVRYHRGNLRDHFPDGKHISVAAFVCISTQLALESAERRQGLFRSPECLLVKT